MGKLRGGSSAGGYLIYHQGFKPSQYDLGFGVVQPTAGLHLKAGVATAGGAPLKLTAGTNLTAAEAGAVEFDGTNLYITDSTNARRGIATATHTIAFTTTAATALTLPTSGTVTALGNTTTGTAGSAIVLATSPTITTPRINAIHHATNTNLAVLNIAGVASAVNSLTITNAATGGAVTIGASGTDTNVSLNLTTKGTSGTVQVNGNVIFHAGNYPTYAVFHGLTAKTSAVDADEFLIWDSASPGYKKITRANFLSGLSMAPFVIKRREFIATANQTAFNISGTGTYTTGNNTMSVYLNGQILPPTAYTETSTTVVTLASGVLADDSVILQWIETTSVPGALATHGSMHLPGGGDAIPLANATTAGLLSAADYNKLQNIAGQISAASGSSSGLMTAAMYNDLQAAKAGGVKATDTTLGLVMGGGSVNIDSEGRISVKDDSHNHALLHANTASAHGWFTKEAVEALNISSGAKVQEEEPGSPGLGLFWYVPSTGALKLWTGSVWVGINTYATS